MRTSNIVLLVVLLVFLGTLTALAVSLRVKVDHQWYTSSESATEEWENVPLGVFSKLTLDGCDGVSVTKGNANVLRVRKGKQNLPAFHLQGDQLLLGDSGHYVGGMTIVVQDLSAITLKRSDNCSLTGFKSDSLSLWSEGGGVQIDSSDFGGLRVYLKGGSNLTLSNSSCGALSLDMSDDQTTLHLQNDHVKWVKGRWKDAISLDMDAATLQNGIEKIEHIQ